MESVTFKIEKSELDALDEEAEENNKTRSQYLREIVYGRHDDEQLRKQVERLQEQVKRQQAEYEEKIDQLTQDHEAELAELRQTYEEEIEHLEAQVDRLQRTNLKILEQRDENTELQVYVDQQREWQQADWFTRQKWKLLGRPD